MQAFRHDSGRAKPRRRWLARAGLGLLLAAWTGPVFAAGLDYQLVSIATGGRRGVYYFAGGTICSFSNAERWTTGIRCIAESTNGSIENLRAVRSGRQTFGIVQSDWQFHAVRGSNVFESVGPDRDLRALFSLFPEPFTVVARPDAGIARFEDLQGKRVNLGPEGSGGRATMDLVMAETNWSETDFDYVAELPMDALPDALCAGEIDAAVFIVAHPNLTVDEMMTECDAHLVPVVGEGIASLIAGHPEYFRAEIPARTYAGQVNGVPGFALAATMVTSARTLPSLVETIVASVFENLDALRVAHPAFADLEPRAMVKDGLTAPLHEGARRYYQKMGLIPPSAPGG